MTRPARARVSARLEKVVRRPSRRDESGASAVELVLYMPLLMFVILFAVQFSLVYLGGQVASGAAREAARTARVTGNAGAAQTVGDRIVRDIGKGVLDDARVVPQVGAERARVTVSGEAQQILPFLPIPRVSETVEGPVERYVQDTGATP